MNDLLASGAISTLEVIRALVAIFGLWVSWHGRRLANEQLALISSEPSDDLHVRRERELRDTRMRLYGAAQGAFCLVHAMLLTNAVVNMGYASAPTEQPNVLVSNVAQVMIPLVLTRVSQLISAQLHTAMRLYLVTGSRDEIVLHLTTQLDATVRRAVTEAVGKLQP